MVPFLLNPGWNIPKKIPKKYKIIKKKCHSGSNSSQTELRQVEEEKKVFSFWVSFLPNPSWSIPKKIQK